MRLKLVSKYRYIVQWNPALYGHLGNTVTSLLRPLFFDRLAKTAIHFLEKKKKTFVNTATPLIWPIFFGPLVTVLTGFHCIWTAKDRHVPEYIRHLEYATISEQLVPLDCFCLNQYYDCVTCLHLVLTRLWRWRCTCSGSNWWTTYRHLQGTSFSNVYHK